MAKRLISDYTFNATNGQVTLTNPADSALVLRRLLMIQNQTRGVAIFSPFEPNKTATLTGTVIDCTFDTETAGHANNDQLMIWYDDPTGESIEQTQILSELLLCISEFAKKLDVYSDGSGRLQVALTSGATQGNLSFLNVCQNVASVGAFGIVPGQEFYRLPSISLENQFNQLIVVTP